MSYAIMWRFAETQMSVGRPIIVDCPLARRELYDAGAALANKVCYIAYAHMPLHSSRIVSEGLMTACRLLYVIWVPRSKVPAPSAAPDIRIWGSLIALL